MKRLTKHAVALLCVLMCVTYVLGGCAGPAATQTSAPPATTATEQPSATPSVEVTQTPAETATTQPTTPVASLPFGNGTTLRFAGLEGWYAAVTLADNLPVWQEFEKRTGVHIKWEVSSDYDTAMQPRVASGTDLPDIMLVPPAWGNSGVFKLASDGIIIPLDDLIAKYAPDIQRLLAGDPDLKGLLTAPDGKQYTIADTPKYVNGIVASSFFIRQDWLDKLGLKAPTTTDEWESVLKAFKDKDPNGNGKADEIPFTGGYYPLSFFGSAFGLTSGTSTWWADSSNKVYCQYATQEYKNLLTYLNKLYSEGLIDKELNRDEANTQSLVSTNVVGSFATLCGYLTLYDNLLIKTVPTVNHQCVVPPAGSDGSVKILKRDPVWSHYGITRDCKSPEIAIQWMNYVWGSDDGVILNEYGLEGKTYTMGSDGKPHYTDFVLHNPEGLDMYNALRSLGASDTEMVRTPMDVYIEMQKGAKSLPFEQSILKYRVEPFPRPMGTTEEQSVLDSVSTDFNTYVTEMQMKFLTGAEPLSNFDTYLNTLNKLGLDQLQQVYQAQYNRAKGLK